MSDITAAVDDRLHLVIETGPDYPEGGNQLCYLTIVDGDGEVAEINSPSKPFEHFSKVMVRNIIVKRLDEYEKDHVDELLDAAFESKRAELDDIYGWP